jgi:hypothetical protein
MCPKSLHEKQVLESLDVADVLLELCRINLEKSSRHVYDETSKHKIGIHKKCQATKAIIKQ